MEVIMKKQFFIVLLFTAHTLFSAEGGSQKIKLDEMERRPKELPEMLKSIRSEDELSASAERLGMSPQQVQQCVERAALGVTLSVEPINLDKAKMAQVNDTLDRLLKNTKCKRVNVCVARALRHCYMAQQLLCDTNLKFKIRPAFLGTFAVELVNVTSELKRNFGPESCAHYRRSFELLKEGQRLVSVGHFLDLHANPRLQEIMHELTELTRYPGVDPVLQDVPKQLIEALWVQQANRWDLEFFKEIRIEQMGAEAGREQTLQKISSLVAPKEAIHLMEFFEDVYRTASKPSEDPTVCDKISDTEYRFNPFLFGLYEKMYTFLTPNNCPPTLVLQGQTFAYPPHLDGVMTRVVVEEAPQKQLAAQGPQKPKRGGKGKKSSNGKKKKKKPNTKKVAQQELAASADSEDDNEELDELDPVLEPEHADQEDAVLDQALPEPGIVPGVQQQSILFYTRAARRWAQNPQVQLERDGYHAVHSANDYELVRRNIFLRFMQNYCNGDPAQADQMIIDNHTLPVMLDRHIVRLPARELQPGEFEVCVPVMRQLPDQSYQHGVYEVMYRTTPNGHCHIYHKVFKMMDRATFIADHLQGNPVRLDQELVDLEQNEQEQADWEPAPGNDWIEDNTNRLFTIFTNQERNIKYFLLK